VRSWRAIPPSAQVPCRVRSRSRAGACPSRAGRARRYRLRRADTPALE
jgi:hypothetical protein